MKYDYHLDGAMPNTHFAIFVFGSNQAGVHGAGAARAAEDYFLAESGVGEGITGQSYAIPTKNERLRTRPLHLIRDSVDMFLTFARSHPNRTFFITRVGCGLAGYRDGQIAPMFKGAPANCNFPEQWKEWLE